MDFEFELKKIKMERNNIDCPSPIDSQFVESDVESSIDFEFKLKKIKMDWNDTDCPSPTDSTISVCSSSQRRKFNLPAKMHAVVQTNIPVAQAGCQTTKCATFDAACQTKKKLNKCESCIERVHYRHRLKDASSQTDEILAHDRSKSTTMQNSRITPTQSVLYLSQKEDQELIIFQDVALIDLMIDKFYRYQLALLATVRNSQIKDFIQNMLMTQIYGNMVNTIHTFLKQIIATTRYTNNINMISATKLVNSLWIKQEHICKSVDVPSDLFTSILRRCFTALQGTQAVNLSLTQPSVMSTGSMSRPSYNLLNFVNMTEQAPQSPYIARNNYWSYGQNMSNNVVSSSTNPHDLPVLTVTDIREELRREELRRNQCRY